MQPSYNLSTFLFYQVNSVKFNEYSSVVVSAGYDRSVRAWDCRSHSTEPIQASIYVILETRRNLFYGLLRMILSLLCECALLCMRKRRPNNHSTVDNFSSAFDSSDFNI